MKSYPDQLRDALYGDMSHLGTGSPESGSATGLATRLCMLAERHDAVRALNASPDTPGLQRYVEWLHDELNLAAMHTDKVRFVNISPNPGGSSVSLVKSDGSAEAVIVPIDQDRVLDLAASGRFWERDDLYVSSATYAKQMKEQFGNQIAKAIPDDGSADAEQAAYDRGYRDCMEGVVAALLRSHARTGMCVDVVSDALERHGEMSERYMSERVGSRP